MLHRLLCYADFTLVGQITDVPANVRLELYVDADFAGDSDSALSTNGGWLRVARSNGTSWPLSWISTADCNQPNHNRSRSDRNGLRAIHRSIADDNTVSLVYPQ